MCAVQYLPQMNVVDIGYVARPHGIRGELRVIPYNPESTTLTQVDIIFIGGTPYELLAARLVEGAFLVRVAGIVDRNQAEPLRGLVVAVGRELIPLDDGEVLLVDLVGCEAVLADGTPWGTITAIEPGAQDRLVIHHGQVERLLPVVPAFIESVDLDARRVIVSPPEGLPESPVPGPGRNE